MKSMKNNDIGIRIAQLAKAIAKAEDLKRLKSSSSQSKEHSKDRPAEPWMSALQRLSDAWVEELPPIDPDIENEDAMLMKQFIEDSVDYDEEEREFYLNQLLSHRKIKGEREISLFDGL